MSFTKWHGKADFVTFVAHFIAIVLHVTKWHRTGAGAHFVKCRFESVFHEVARD